MTEEKKSLDQRLEDATLEAKRISQQWNETQLDYEARLSKLQTVESALRSTESRLTDEKRRLQDELDTLKRERDIAQVIGATTTAAAASSNGTHSHASSDDLYDPYSSPSMPPRPSPFMPPTPSTPVLTTSELSSLSLAFFPELEPLLGGIPPVPSAHVYTAAAVYLHDSFHCRSIKHSTTLPALKAYQFIHVSKWKFFIRMVGWLHVLLGFIEPPSSIMYNGERLGPGHSLCGAIELSFLLIYLFHMYQQFRAYGPGKLGYWRSPWRMAKVPILAACIVDVIVSILRNDDDGPGIHISQILRVFFVLEQSARMRQLCSCIVRSLPQIVSIMFLAFVHIFAFSIIGFLFIGPLEEVSPLHADHLYFDTLGNSFLSVFILLTSENFPECMLPSYRRHWFVCIYFIVFVIIGLYGLLQLTTAVVFHSFQLNTKSKLQRALHHRERALQASFTLISEYTCGDGFIQLDAWTKLIRQLRPDWTDTQAEILFRAATAPQIPTSENGNSGANTFNDTPRGSLKRFQQSLTRLSVAEPPHGLAPTSSSINDTQSTPVSSPSSSSSASHSSHSLFSSPAPSMDFLQFEQIVRFTQHSFQFEMEPEEQIAGDETCSNENGMKTPLKKRDSSLSSSSSSSSSSSLSASLLQNESPSAATTATSMSILMPPPNVAIKMQRLSVDSDTNGEAASVAAAAAAAAAASGDVALNEDGLPTSYSDLALDRAPERQQPKKGCQGRLQQMLIKYFTLRLPLPNIILQLSGRTEQHITERENEERLQEDTFNDPPKTPLHPNIRIRQRLTTFSLSNLVSDVLVILHAILLVTHIALRHDDTPSSALHGLESAIILLEVQFMGEVLCKMWICGWSFWKNKLQVVDFLTTIVVWIGQILVLSSTYGTGQDAISSMRVARTIRLYHRLASFTLLLQVLNQVGPALLALLGVLFILLYFYSMIGMMFFCNELELGKPGLANTDYDLSDFYVLNFNDLAHSLISLFYQLVVNDWFVLMEAVVARVGHGARIFFISFYCVSVLIVFSVCTAFVVEAYMNLHEERIAQASKGKEQSLTQTAPIPSMPKPISLAPGMVKKEVKASKKAKSRKDNSFDSSIGTSASPPMAVQSSDGLRERRQSQMRTARSFRQFHQALQQRSFSGNITNAGSLSRAESMRSGNGSPAPIMTTGPAVFSSSPVPSSLSAAVGGSSASFSSSLSSSGSSSHYSFRPPPLSLGDRNPFLGSAPMATPDSPGAFLSMGPHTPTGSYVRSGTTPTNSSDQLLLSRIRDRASFAGLKVKMKPSGGMVNTLKNMFGNELNEEAEEDADDTDD